MIFKNKQTMITRTIKNTKICVETECWKKLQTATSTNNPLYEEVSTKQLQSQ